MSGCAAFAQVVGSTRIEAELLPQWWEQVRGIYHHTEYPGIPGTGGLNFLIWAGLLDSR